jgi:outer membrane protein assembly factor BamB
MENNGRLASYRLKSFLPSFWELFMHRRLSVGLLITCWFTLASAASPEKDWPGFRGINRTGVSPDTGLLQKWPDGGPPRLWEAKGAGRGYASLAISDGRLYTLGDGLSTADNEDEYLSCFDLKDGSQLWKTRTGRPWKSGNADWQSSRSTPAVDGELVYVITPHGELICCRSANGEEVWRKNLEQEYGGKKEDRWGYSESPLIDGEKLVCTPGGPKSTMIALNKKTGELLWTCTRADDSGAGHASIVISNVGGEKVYVNTTGSGALGVRAKDGKLLWSYPIGHTTAVIPTPIVRGDLVFFTAGYNRGGALLKQVPAGDGEVKVEEVYGLKPELGNKHGGVVLVGDYLYGDSEDRGTPFCAEFMTGKVLWKKRGSGKNSAAVAAADGHLYFLFADGTLVLAKADPADYEEVSSFKVGDGKRPCWAHPVIVDSKLYIRDQDRILCYDLKAK